MRIVSLRPVDLPIQRSEAYGRTRYEQGVVQKRWAVLPCGFVSQRDRVPMGYAEGQTWRYGGLGVRKMLLQRSVPTAMITVEVGVDDEVKGLSVQRLPDKAQRLFCMGPVAGVHQCCWAVTLYQDVVG